MLRQEILKNHPPYDPRHLGYLIGILCARPLTKIVTVLHRGYWIYQGCDQTMKKKIELISEQT